MMGNQETDDMRTVPTNRPGIHRGGNLDTGVGASSSPEQQLLEQSECEGEFCKRRCISRLCKKCRSDPGSRLEDVGIREDGFAGGRMPSRRELQNDINRLEGKLDALLQALDVDVEDGGER